MAKPTTAKAKKLGRNDPCHCGSGRKYKDCHLPIEEAARGEQLRLRQAQDSLLPKIIEAAQSVPDQFPPAFARFWQEKYAVEQMAELDEIEDRGAERFLTWFAFDFRQADGRTLLGQLDDAADTGGFDVDPSERKLLALWREVRLRPYVVDGVRKGKGLSLHDLLSGAAYEVADYNASKRLIPGEVVVGHLTPADTAPGAAAPTYYLAGAAAQLTDDTAEKLLEFVELHMADLRRRAPDSTWDDLIDERSEILNHFVTALPHEQRDPTVMEKIVAEGRIALQLTAESVAALLGRALPESEVEDQEAGVGGQKSGVGAPDPGADPDADTELEGKD
ncbi:SEC-C domain-containing protein [Oscillochloris sp. ZM17-4]|uniref:YecA family protein n=1 Tax=Oscillochloris sp. ZM17-4 TaxID=2866714 RepID=UPI001C733D36|nr:SEC-C domain-containing protein [Oscillochloris sp. ZM17-4]MBX0329935.1 SEC-C domain-containing protein [Oscillochloris sp. ZM17-4]